MKLMWKQEQWDALLNRRLSAMSVLKGQIEAYESVVRTGLIDARVVDMLGCSLFIRWWEEALAKPDEWDDDSSDDETDEEDETGLPENNFGNCSESDWEGISEEIPEKES